MNFAVSASSSASSRTQHGSNIADLTRRQEKIQEMQGKYAEAQNEDNLTAEAEMNSNEATPNLLQKKINKILTKLKLISSISNILNTNNGDNDNNSTEGSNNVVTTGRSGIEITEENSNTTSNKNKEEVEEIPEMIFQKSIYPKSINESPIKFTLGFNERTEDNTEANETNKSKEMNRFGQVGVFLAEVLGSIVALAYGAAIQLTHLTQGTLTPPTD